MKLRQGPPIGSVWDFRGIESAEPDAPWPTPPMEPLPDSEFPGGSEFHDLIMANVADRRVLRWLMQPGVGGSGQSNDNQLIGGLLPEGSNWVQNSPGGLSYNYLPSPAEKFRERKVEEPVMSMVPASQIEGLAPMVVAPAEEPGGEPGTFGGLWPDAQPQHSWKREKIVPYSFVAGDPKGARSSRVAPLLRRIEGHDVTTNAQKIAKKMSHWQKGDRHR